MLFDSSYTKVRVWDCRMYSRPEIAGGVQTYFHSSRYLIEIINIVPVSPTVLLRTVSITVKSRASAP